MKNERKRRLLMSLPCPRVMCKSLSENSLKYTVFVPGAACALAPRTARCLAELIAETAFQGKKGVGIPTFRIQSESKNKLGENKVHRQPFPGPPGRWFYTFNWRPRPGSLRIGAASTYFFSMPKIPYRFTSLLSSASVLVRGTSLGQTLTQFCALPHSAIPPSPMSISSRSSRLMSPVG